LVYSSFWAAHLSLATSGYVLNEAIEAHLYYSGSFYDLPFTLALACFTLIGLLGWTLPITSPAEKISGKALHLVKLGRSFSCRFQSSRSGAFSAAMPLRKSSISVSLWWRDLYS
jgi:hypothetical protein